MKRFAVIIVLLLLPFAAFAGEPDAGTWTYLALKHDFSEKYSVATDQRFVRIFNRYKFLPWLTGEVNFEGNQSDLGGGQWRNAFRIHLGLNASARIGDFRLSTLQREYFFVASNVEPAKPCFLLSQFRIGYAPKDWAVGPYITALWLTRPETFQRRLIAGADIRIFPSASLNIYYMFKTAYPSEKSTNILGLGLTVKI